MKYYFFVSYLPEIHRDDRKVRVRAAELLAERPHFAVEDWGQIELVLLAGDVVQIERLLAGKDTEISLCLQGRGFWQEQMRSPREVPPPFAEFFERLAADGFSVSLLHRLYEAYYAYALEKAGPGFLRAYLTFERDLRNILAAIRARRQGLEAVHSLIGESDLVEVLSRSNAEDFGLGGEYPWIVQLLNTREPSEIDEAVQRVTWEVIDGLTEQSGFEFDLILAYLLKVSLVERNLALKEEQGLEIIRRLEEL